MTKEGRKRARIESQSLASRLAGISILGFGASWKPPEPERDVVRSVITFLEDKRVLYEAYAFEIPRECIESILKIREVLTNGIQRVSEQSPASEGFRIMRASCREFLSHPQRWQFDTKSYPPDLFFVDALAKLRGVFGQQVAVLSYLYRVDVESGLASILPPKAEAEQDDNDLRQ